MLIVNNKNGGFYVLRILNVYIYKKQISAIISAIIIAFAALLVTPIINAQESGGSGLSISPTRTELSLEPGAADTVTVSLKNITSGSILAKVFVNDFEPDNETGEPRLVVDPDRKTAASISEFVSGIEDVELAAGESKDVTVDVAIPNNAAPGGYYGALRFQAVPFDADSPNVDQGNQVSLTANLLSLVLIEVPGDIEEKVGVNKPVLYIDEKSGSFFTKKPNFVGIKIDNEGNGFIKPFGRVSVKNNSGNEIFTYELNDANPRSNVLPASSRVFKDRLVNIETKTVNGADESTESSPISSPGRYSVEASISYGNGGEVFTVTSTFWYIPTWLIITIAVIILLLLGGAYFVYRRYSTRSTRRR
jgi:hypothetical protein